MNNKNPNTEMRARENGHLAHIEIIVPQSCIDFRKQPKEQILVDESLYYSLALFNVLMMVSSGEVHIDTDITFAIRTLGFLGKTFTDIAITNAELLEVKKDA